MMKSIDECEKEIEQLKQEKIILKHNLAHAKDLLRQNDLAITKLEENILKQKSLIARRKKQMKQFERMREIKLI